MYDLARGGAAVPKRIQRQRGTRMHVIRVDHAYLRANCHHIAARERERCYVQRAVVNELLDAPESSAKCVSVCTFVLVNASDVMWREPSSTSFLMHLIAPLNASVSVLLY